MFVLSLILTLIIPSLAWGYIFSYNEDRNISKEKFFLGMISWGFAVVSVIIINKLLLSNSNSFLNPFFSLHKENIIWIDKITSTWLPVIVISILSLLSSYLLFHKKAKHNFWYFLDFKKNFLIWILLIIFTSSLISLFFTFFPELNIEISDSIKFKEVAFSSIKLVLFYYVIVAIIEESSKYLNFLWTMFSPKEKFKKWIIYSIIVAFWFAVVENIIYVYNIYKDSGFSSELITTIFLRSIFSVSAHILFSVVISYFYLKEENKKIISKQVIIWILISIWLHVLYDVGLSTNISPIFPILYLIWSYLFITHVFYYKKN